MEARKTRESLNALPPDLGLVSNPLDPMHKLIDVIGRETQIAEEYIKKQLFNINPVTADPTEPSIYYSSGNAVPLGSVLTGSWVEDINDIASMEVTGFDFVGIVYPSGIASPLFGISYSQDPDHSGWLMITASGSRYVHYYEIEDLTAVVASGTVGVVTQEYDTTQHDEYLVIERDTEYGTIATLKHTPAGDVTVIDTKNLSTPWDQTSDGITVPAGDISVSGNVLILADPRPSYNPATMSGNYPIYPADYQPDQDWSSTFLAEYDWFSHEEPWGICQPTTRHELGLGYEPLAAMKEL